MAKNMNPSEGDPGGGQSAQDTNCPKTKQLFDSCKKDYEEKRDKAVSATKVAATDKEASVSEKKIKSNIYDCLFQANRKYVELTHGIENEAGENKHGVSAKLQQDILELENCVAEAKKKDSELEGLLKEAVKKIREAKDALSDMYDVACVLSSCVDDSKNSEQRKALVENIVKTPASTSSGSRRKKVAREEEEPEEEMGEKDFLTIICDIMDCAKDTKDYADTAFEASIKVYSLNGYNSVEILEGETADLKTTVTAFTDDVADNVKYNTGELASKSESLLEAITDCSTKAYALCKASGSWLAKNDAATYDDSKPVPEESSTEDPPGFGIGTLLENAQGVFMDGFESIKDKDTSPQRKSKK